MVAPELFRATSHGVTLLGDFNRPGGVTFAFTERTGGVSQGCFASLNLYDGCGDDPHAVASNLDALLVATGTSHLAGRLVRPLQVHGDHVVVVGEAGDESVREAMREAREGADAVVCTVPDVPVLLCFADCVPVVLVVPGGFAVVHSGWKGSIARISAKALSVLVRQARCDVGEALAYVGPHIGGSDYEVSEELSRAFGDEFGETVFVDAEGTVGGGSRHLDLGACVVRALEDAGMDRSRMAIVQESTCSHTDRFFSYRASGGSCGRHGAFACIISGRGSCDMPGHEGSER